jgi:hypothetical protein
MIGVTRAKTMQQRQCPFNPRISAMALSMKTARPAVRSSVSRRTVKVQAALDPTLAVGGSTVAMLALVSGRKTKQDGVPAWEELQPALPFGEQATAANATHTAGGATALHLGSLSSSLISNQRHPW